MKAEHLHILRVIDYQGDDPDLMNGSEALYQRHVSRGLGSVIFWEYNTKSRHCRVLKRVDKPGPWTQNVGLYVVGNGNMMDGLMGVEVATLAHVIRDQMGLRQLRKLSLVSSYLGETMYGGTPTAPALVGSRHAHQFKTYADAVCAQLGAMGYLGLKTAAWGNEIYINDGNTAIIESARIPAGAGKKLADIRDGSPTVNRGPMTTQYRRDNKVFLKWDAAKGVTRISYDDWHDG